MNGSLRSELTKFGERIVNRIIARGVIKDLLHNVNETPIKDPRKSYKASNIPVSFDVIYKGECIYEYLQSNKAINSHDDANKLYEVYKEFIEALLFYFNYEDTRYYLSDVKLQYSPHVEEYTVILIVKKD